MSEEEWFHAEIERFRAQLETERARQDHDDVVNGFAWIAIVIVAVGLMVWGWLSP